VVYGYLRHTPPEHTQRKDVNAITSLPISIFYQKTPFLSFGESGKPLELLEKYGLNVDAIVNAAKRAVGRK